MGHSFLIAAYCCTWAIHLSYLGWIAVKWSNQANRPKPGTNAGSPRGRHAA